jgi:hypothetical protein
MANIKHDIWRSKEELTSLCYSDELGEESRSILEPDSEIIHSFYANSHFDAMTKYYEFMNWGIYETEFEIDKVPYDLQALKNRAKIRLEIDGILWNDWDPIAVNDCAPRDKYQSYIPRILYMVINESTSEEISNELYLIETEMMGLLGDKKRCNEISKKIKKATDHHC